MVNNRPDPTRIFCRERPGLLVRFLVALLFSPAGGRLSREDRRRYGNGFYGASTVSRIRYPQQLLIQGTAL
ncbi:hypothetical protein B0T21DRAFT_155033 [Apiosordaria backusii]|uniref:Uncharacterized protein n=1 Tax=Apiosordaria backusii TaxID=314023 RepID=A0AA40BMJ0_9PEZI|nr:hypothetical protein B0T21DRAFT_155033 [Apiosordaria backusii]